MDVSHWYYNVSDFHVRGVSLGQLRTTYKSGYREAVGPASDHEY